MTGTSEQPDIVEIAGKQYNRVLAEEIARDIEYVSARRPGAWAITSNSAFVVGASSYLSFEVPVRHGYLVEGAGASEAVQALIDQYQSDFRSKSHPEVRALHLPNEGLHENLRLLRPAHEEAIDHALEYSKRCNWWREHDFNHVRMLEEIIGSPLPEPAYSEELRLIRLAVESGNPIPVSEEVRYWKISPGSSGVHWSTFQDRSLIAMHWSDELVDLADYPAAHPEFVAMVKSELGVGNQDARSLWDFSKVMQPGDQVLAYANQQVVGYGTVTGNYQLVDDDFEYMHRRAVEWTSTEPRPIGGLSLELQKRLSTQATLFELTREQFLVATGQQDEGVMSPDTSIGLGTVRDQFAANGLHYTEAQVATFVTALQTKGFVVLSGISGTGKSKIATGFVEMLPDGCLPDPSTSTAMATDGIHGEWILRKVNSYVPENGDLILPIAQFGQYPLPETSQQYAIRVSFEGVESHGSILMGDNPDRKVAVLKFSGEVRERLRSLKKGDQLLLRVELNEDGDRIDLIAMKRGEPAGMSLSAISSNPGLPNHLFLSVRPDWRDSTSLLGYYNPLTETYEWTDFLRFVIRAGDNYNGPVEDRIAWFVILDEMNLAHVEYYFADFLSVLESGRDDTGWTREPLRLTYPDTLDDEVPPRELRLPPNLYIIGTVNMDETTHAFSPKVLDRAFTIELTDVDFATYAITGQAGDASLSDDEKAALLAAFSRDGRFIRIDKGEIARIVGQHPEIRDHLQSLNVLLRRDRFHFGYRVFDEIGQYLAVNDENGMMSFVDAFDQAVFMKVLPKFTGSRSRLRSPLLSVLAWAIDPESPDVTGVTNRFDAHVASPDTAPAVLTEGPAYPATARRVLQMLDTLETEGFVSFG